MLAPGDSERSVFPVGSSVVEMGVGITELLFSMEELDEGSDTTMYFCMGREPGSVGPLPGSTFTKGCKVDVTLGTVLVTVEADWEELMVITCWEIIQIHMNACILQCCKMSLKFF